MAFHAAITANFTLINNRKKNKNNTTIGRKSSSQVLDQYNRRCQSVFNYTITLLVYINTSSRWQYEKLEHIINTNICSIVAWVNPMDCFNSLLERSFYFFPRKLAQFFTHFILCQYAMQNLRISSDANVLSNTSWMMPHRKLQH